MKKFYIIFLSFFMLLANTYADDLTDALRVAQQHLATGHYREAERYFALATAKAQQQKDAYNLVLIQALQGYMALQRQDHEQAETLLTTALTQAKQQQWYDLIVRIDLYLAQFAQHHQQESQALAYFQDAAALSEKVTDKSLLVSTYYQLANLAIDKHNSQQAWQYLQQASQLVQELSPSPINSQLWLNIGYQNLQLYILSPQKAFLASAFDSLNKALILAKQHQQPRIQASALKHLASLYKQQQHDDEAIKLLLEGITQAQKEDANDLLVDLEWRLGQLYQQQKHNNSAIAAYRRAVQHIDRIRIDIPVSYQQGRSSFRDTFAPIYLSLADLLLQASDHSNGKQQQALLAEARDSIERMKKSELEDFFQSRCDIPVTPLNLQRTDPHAAALYPIPLKDRLEIIIYTADGLRRFTSQVTAKELEQQARLFSEHLRNYSDFSKSRGHARLLYYWLIEPVEELLKKQHIDTLIYIPDGALRLVPLAALYSGKKFVIEDYAVVTSPGMSLIDTNGIRKQKRMLIAGMSVPGNVVSDLPDVLLGDLVVDTPSIRGGASQALLSQLKQVVQATANSRELKKSFGQRQDNPHELRQLRELLRKPEVVDQLQQVLALPGVDIEIKQLAEQNQTNYLLNDSFSLENFIQLLKEEPHDILHIASHGFFGSTAEESFIMTHNKILNLNQLEVLLSADYFKQYPIDLLTLSACQTAEGDDRSPLGISGVAIKTKVHSALGSLWPVSDEATAELMAVFYKSLNKPEQTKAKALQEAMLAILKQPKYANPSYWSPFILIGSWL